MVSHNIVRPRRSLKMPAEKATLLGFHYVLSADESEGAIAKRRTRISPKFECVELVYRQKQRPAGDWDGMVCTSQFSIQEVMR